MICQDLCRMVRALCRVQYLKKFGNLSVVLGNGGRKLLCRFFSKHVWQVQHSFSWKICHEISKFYGKWLNPERSFRWTFPGPGDKIPWDLSVYGMVLVMCSWKTRQAIQEICGHIRLSQNPSKYGYICSTLEDDLLLCDLKGRSCFLSLLIVHDGVRFGSTSCQYSPLSNGCCVCCLKTDCRFGPDVVDRSRYVSFMHRQIRTPPRPTESWFCVKSHPWKTTVTEALVECHQTSSALETQEPPIFLDIFGLLVGILKDFLEQSCCCTSDRDPQQVHKETRYFCDLVFQTFRFSKQMEPHGTVCWSKSLGDSNQGERFLFAVVSHCIWSSQSL